jgi:hypothetical protein
VLLSTFAAFQDELIKIAGAMKLMSPEDAEKFFGSHAQRVANVEAMASKMDADRMATGATRIHDASGATKVHDTAARTAGDRTVASRRPVAPAQVAKPPAAVHAPVHAPAGVPRTTALPHPAVPGGMASAMRRGGSMLRAHATPLGIGAGLGLGAGALALHGMRNRNAASR